MATKKTQTERRISKNDLRVLSDKISDLEKDLYGNGKEGLKTMVTAIAADVRWMKAIGGWFFGIITALMVAILVKIFGGA